MAKAKKMTVAQLDRKLEQQADQYGKAFHVLVEWPDSREQPWLILIHAKDAAEARRVVENSNDVRESGGKVARVDVASNGDVS